jgi:hypothetical protein
MDEKGEKGKKKPESDPFLESSFAFIITEK